MSYPPIIVLVLRILVAIAVLVELTPRTWTLWRMRSVDDGYGVDRLRTWLKSSGIQLVSVFESMVWADYIFSGQAVLGRFEERWVLDTMIWSLMLVGSVQVARLYWSIEWKRGDPP